MKKAQINGIIFIVMNCFGRLIIFLIKPVMERKTALLNTLKQHVQEIKKQLSYIQKPKNDRQIQGGTSHRSRSTSQSSRLFNTTNFQFLHNTSNDRGVKKFLGRTTCFKNISQLISDKSQGVKTPRMSDYRRQENRRTKENFCTDNFVSVTPGKRGPNPLTGEGYIYQSRGRQEGDCGSQKSRNIKSQKALPRRCVINSSIYMTANYNI